MSDEAPPWSEESLAFLALADVALDTALAKRGFAPVEAVIADDPAGWTKTVAGRLGPHWIVVRAWSTPSLAALEQANLWLYAFEREPDGYDLDRDRLYSTSERGADELRALLDRLLDGAASAAFGRLREAFRDAQTRHNSDQAPSAFVAPKLRGFTN